MGQTSVSVDFVILRLHCAGVSSILGSINFLVTIRTLKAPGLTPLTLSLFV